jgi:integrase/recombinase XerD
VSRQGLCCECGSVREFARGRPVDGEDGLRLLRCGHCGTLTRHAVMADDQRAPGADVATEFIAWMQSWGASARTIEARAIVARSRLAAWGLDGLTTANIAAYLGGHPEWSRWTRATYYNHLKSFCEFLVVSGRLERSPMDGIRKSRRPAPEPRPLTEEEVERVLAAAKGRTRDFLLLALLAGLRAHEIAKVRGEDFQAEGLRVLGKGGKVSVLPVHPEIRAMTRRYPREGCWFPSPYGEHINPDTISAAVSDLFRSQGVTGSIHRLRHNFGTRLLRSGANIRVVQELMRHTSLATTAAYTAVDEDEKAAAVALLPSV